MMKALSTLRKIQNELNADIKFYELRKVEKYTDTSRYEGAIVALKNFRDTLNIECDKFIQEI